MGFEIQDISPCIGARIFADKETLLGGERSGELRELWEQRGILVFPGIHLTDDEQLRFSATLGEIVKHHGQGIYKVSLDARKSAMADYLRGTVLWHIDGFVDDVPPRGSILSARRLSDVGGQTEFCNTYAAWEQLPEARKQQLDGIKVAHTMEAAQRDIYQDASDERRAEWAGYPPKIHPLVWTHQSGRKSLLLGSGADWIDGMDRDEGRALLRELHEWAVSPRFVYRHEWQIGDTVIWDNSGTMHRVEPYPEDSDRMMHRTTIVGEEAVA